METILRSEEKERVILTAVTSGDGMPSSVDELKELVKTAGAETVAVLVQRRSAVHPKTYLGTGKLLELEEMIRLTDATGIVCDDELTPAQIRSMEEVLHTKVMDRTLVILDIFAAHATTGEGKLQVELAQLRHRLTQLTGIGRDLSRLGGGIGTRGPGEKKLETDRRLIGKRISRLKRELTELQQHRDLTREQRMSSDLPIAAIVGYTNAGKSTLLNKLTGAEVLTADQLFATLDPTTRLLEFSGKRRMLLTDTVGFIQKLPHHLVEAFRSTLEEAKYADLIIHVVDSSNPYWEEQVKTVYETLQSLGIRGQRILTVFNKSDLPPAEEHFFDFRADRIVHISAKRGDGLDEMKETLLDLLRMDMQFISRLFSYAESGKIASIRKNGELLKEEYRADGIFVEAFVPTRLFGQLS